jgi:hypothetical protein
MEKKNMDTEKSIFDKSLTDLSFKERVLFIQPILNDAREGLRELKIYLVKIDDKELLSNIKKVESGMNHSLFTEQNCNLLYEDKIKLLYHIKKLEYKLNQCRKENEIDQKTKNL